MKELSVVNIYLSWNCNFKCIHCWVDGGTSCENVALDADTCIDMLEKALLLGLEHVKLTGGEPLLFMDTIFPILTWCDDNDISVTIETNGSVITEQFAACIVERDVSISISVNGFDSPSHDNFVVCNGSFVKVIDNINILKKYGVNFQIITCVYDGNKQNLEKIVALCKELGALSLKINPITDIGRGEDLYQSKKIDDYIAIKDLVPIVHGLSKSYGIEIFLHVPPAFRGFNTLKSAGGKSCAYKNMLSILPDKSLALCGYGGVNEATTWGKYGADFDLAHFWKNNEGVNLLRDEVRLEGVCKQCVHQKSCQGDCKALAMNRYGSWNSPNPMCQELFENGMFPQSRIFP